VLGEEEYENKIVLVAGNKSLSLRAKRSNPRTRSELLLKAYMGGCFDPYKADLAMTGHCLLNSMFNVGRSMFDVHLFSH